MSVLDRLDEIPPPRNVLSTVHSPVMAELDKIVQIQLLYPFDTLQQIAVRCQRPRGYISQITSSAAYKVLYDKRRREIADALGIPSTVEKIESAIQLTLEKLMDRVEETTDGNFLVKALDVLLKASGQGGYAPQAPINNNILVDARQAAILDIRDRSMALAKEAGPYPSTLRAGQTVIESLPTIEGDELPAGPLGPETDSPPHDEMAALEAELLDLPDDPLASIQGPGARK